jgi:putative redox protein
MSAGAAPAAPPDELEVELEWLGQDRLRGRAGANSLVMDSPPVAGPNPVETLALAFAACMAMDVLVVVRKGRFDLRALSAKLTATRAPKPPRRLLSIRLHFTLDGEVPEDRVARAIELSRDRYCSVWHSMRTDIELSTSFEVRGAGLTGV